MSIFRTNPSFSMRAEYGGVIDEQSFSTRGAWVAKHRLKRFFDAVVLPKTVLADIRDDRNGDE